MSQKTERREEIIEKFQQEEGDTGSSEVQIALLSDRIDSLTEHLQEQPKDYEARRGLLDLVEKRKKHLDYLRENDFDTFKEITEELDL